MEEKNKCAYCKETKKLAIDGSLSIETDETKHICYPCIDNLEESLIEYKKAGKTREEWKKEVMFVKYQKETDRIKSISKDNFRKTLRIPENSPKNNKVVALVSTEIKMTEHLCKHECEKCSIIGILESNGGIMIPIEEGVQEEVMYSDENRLDVPFGIRFSSWDYVLCKSCLKKITNKA